MEVAVKKPRPLGFIFPLFIGLIIVALAIANFYFILTGVYGKFANGQLQPNLNSLASIFQSHKHKAIILNSTYTKNILPQGSTWLEDNLRTWQKFLSNFDYEYEIVSDNYIETKSISEFDLLILPGSKSLSDKEIIQIKKYLEKGGNVLATSGTASYSSDGKWRGWEFFSEVFGIKFSREMSNEEKTRVHTLRGGLPLAANIPAGYALNIATWDRPIAAEVLDPRSIQLSYWYNPKQEHGLVREEIRKSAGIVYGEYGKGRFVWMGFEINSVNGVLEDHIYLERLLKNSLDWLCRNPIAYLRDWPNDYGAAAIILPNLNNDFSSMSSIVNIAKGKIVSPTFIVDQSAFVSENKEQLNLLSRYGEVVPAIAFSYPSSREDTIKNMFDYQTQFESLKQIKIIYENLTKKKINGALAQFGSFDKTTLKALNRADYSVLISDSLNGNSLPKILHAEDKRIIGIFKYSRSDYDVVESYGLKDPNLQFYTYQEDIDRLLFEGGLYVLRLHPQLQLQKNYMDVVTQVIDDLRKKNYWIATASEIAKWVNLKSQVEVGTKRIGKTRIRLTVSNSGNKAATEIEVDADLSQKVSSVEISAEIIGTKLPSYKKLNGGSLIRLTIDELKPHESRIYYIDYDNNKSS